MCRNEYKIIKKSGLFDEKYYLLTYNDVRKADIDPIKHYLKYGWKERRNPSQSFNTNDYIQRNNISLNSKYSPLFHQIKSLSNKQKATTSEYNIIKKSVNENDNYEKEFKQKFPNHLEIAITYGFPPINKYLEQAKKILWEREIKRLLSTNQ